MKEPDYPTGVAASLMAEAGFLFLAVAAMWLQGKSPWMPPRMPATLIVGPQALYPSGFVPHDIVLGLLMHLWLAVLVGVLYAALRPRLGVSPVVGGLITAGILYALGFWVLPALFPEWLASFRLPPDGRILQAILHGLYGLLFGWTFRAVREMRS